MGRQQPGRRGCTSTRMSENRMCGSRRLRAPTPVGADPEGLRRRAAGTGTNWGLTGIAAGIMQVVILRRRRLVLRLARCPPSFSPPHFYHGTTRT